RQRVASMNRNCADARRRTDQDPARLERLTGSEVDPDPTDAASTVAGATFAAGRTRGGRERAGRGTTAASEAMTRPTGSRGARALTICSRRSILTRTMAAVGVALQIESSAAAATIGDDRGSGFADKSSRFDQHASAGAATATRDVIVRRID